MTKTLWLALSSLSLLAFAAGCAGHDDPDPSQSSAEQITSQDEALAPYCKDVGNACSYAGQCCSSTCTAGKCVKAATCRTIPAWCYFSSDCCSNNCVGNHCAAAAK